MPALNKNHSARLRRVDQRLDRALDSLMQANGELWPAQLRPYGEQLQTAVNTLQALSKAIAADISGATIVADPVETQVDVDQEDVEDVEGVAQAQPEPSQIEDIEGDEPQPVRSTRRRTAA